MRPHRSSARELAGAIALLLSAGGASFAGHGPHHAGRSAAPAPPAATPDGGAPEPIAPWAAASAWETDADRLCRGLNELLAAAADEPEEAEPQVTAELVAACEAEADARLAQRRRDAASETIDGLLAIPEAYRLPEEKRRIEALRAARPATPPLARSPGEVRAIALTAGYCVYRRMQRASAAAGAQARRRHDGAEAGRRDEQAHDYGRSMWTIQLSARSAGAKLLACDAPIVAAVASCLGDGASCTDEARGYLPSAPRIWP